MIMENRGTNEEHILHGPVPIVPVCDGTAGQQLFQALKKFEHLPQALISAETHEIISYRELLEFSCRVAHGLSKCGLSSESVISIFSENSVYYYYALLASLFLGVTVSPLNPHYIGGELYHAVDLSKPEIIFCSKNTLQRVLNLKKTLTYVRKIVVLDLDASTQEAESLNSFMGEMVNVNGFKVAEFDCSQKVAAILCSSGTTGLPKGAMITHKNFAVRFAQLKDPIFGMFSEPTTTTLSIFPMCHVGGLVTSLMQLILGFRTIVMARFSLKTYLELIQDYKVDTTLVAPPVLVFLNKSPLVEKYNLSTLREIMCGGAPLSKESINEVLQRLPAVKELRQVYGLTETTLTATISPRGDIRNGSSGKLPQFTSGKVIEIETNKALGPYQQGELCFKGDFVMKGYVNNKTETEEIIDRADWLHTGDIGYYDEDHHFYIVDRLKELIKYKGYQVSPAELEEILVQHPKIKDAAVIGVEDEIAGQLPRAYVVLEQNDALNEAEVANFVVGQVSPQKYLTGGVVFVNDIPRLASGKIARRLLRDMDKQRSIYGNDVFTSVNSNNFILA